MSNAIRKTFRRVLRNECERKKYSKAGRQAGANYRRIKADKKEVKK